MFETIKRKLTEISTWEGFAAIAGAIGLFISPEGAVMIVGGALSIYGGIKLWQRDAKDDA